MAKRKQAKPLADEDLQRDELVLAAIIAGQEASGYKVSRGRWIHNPVEGDACGTACAVGCGLLYAGINSASEAYNWGHPLTALAKKLDVSVDYATGLSDGFETGKSDWPNRELSDDREAGMRLGVVVAEIFGLDVDR